MRTTETAVASRAAMVRWPEEAPRRAALAEAGIPCLLVVQPGAPLPPLGPGEDWIRSTSDERDVAARLARLSRGGRSPGPSPPPLPDGLTPVEHRVAARLAASVGAFTSIADLPIDDRDDLDELVTSLDAALRPGGLCITPVGDAGYLLERMEPDSP